MPKLRFTAEGVLPPGTYDLTFEQLRRSLLVQGPAATDGPSAREWTSNWDATWRRTLVDRLAVLVGQLWSVGVQDVFIDGSFTEDKDHPTDIDGYFVCDATYFASGDLARDLNRLDPHRCWTWRHASRRRYRGYPKRQLPMWHAYRVELYPHCPGVVAGRDKRGVPLEFPSFFRTCRRGGGEKGVVRIVP